MLLSIREEFPLCAFFYSTPDVTSQETAVEWLCKTIEADKITLDSISVEGEHVNDVIYQIENAEDFNADDFKEKMSILEASFIGVVVEYDGAPVCITVGSEIDGRWLVSLTANSYCPADIKAMSIALNLED